MAWQASAMNCPICSAPVPPGTRGQTRIYCSPEHRRRAEHDARRQRRLETFEAAICDVHTRDDVLDLLWASARTGSVLAAKTLLEELRRDGEGAPAGVIDELVAKRAKTTMSAVRVEGPQPRI